MTLADVLLPAFGLLAIYTLRLRRLIRLYATLERLRRNERPCRAMFRVRYQVLHGGEADDLEAMVSLPCPEGVEENYANLAIGGKLMAWHNHPDSIRLLSIERRENVLV